MRPQHRFINRRSSDRGAESLTGLAARLDGALNRSARGKKAHPAATFGAAAPSFTVGGSQKLPFSYMKRICW